MAEIGSGGKFQQEYIELALKGIHNTLKYTGMISGTPEVPDKQVIVTSRKHIRCKSGGMAVVDVAPGQALKKGERFARIIDIGSEKSEVETLVADQDMYVIAARVNPPVDTGDRIIFGALTWEDVKR